jgi:hypothetical protein
VRLYYELMGIKFISFRFVAGWKRVFLSNMYPLPVDRTFVIHSSDSAFEIASACAALDFQTPAYGTALLWLVSVQSSVCSCV